VSEQKPIAEGTLQTIKENREGLRHLIDTPLLDAIAWTHAAAEPGSKAQETFNNLIRGRCALEVADALKGLTDATNRNSESNERLMRAYVAATIAIAVLTAALVVITAIPLIRG